MNSKLIEDLSISEQLMYSTVRIESQDKVGNKSTGTGFYFSFNINNQIIPVIFTNKHVVRDGVYGNLEIKLQSNDRKYIIEGKESFCISNFEESWIMHPDNEIDLCCLPFGPIVNEMKEKGKHLFFKGISENDVIQQIEIDSLTAIEDILMIGYPNGLWDSVNNHPIMRHGKTATHPAYNYNGKEEFVIDAACFPGSSGSPVFLFNQIGYVDKKGSINLGERIKLLGVLYSGPQVVNTGKIEIVEIPTRQEAISISHSLMNLGNIIKAEKLLEFKDLLESIMKNES